MLAKHALYQLSYGPQSQEYRGGAQESGRSIRGVPLGGVW